jgi:alkaline phosphatase
MKYLFCVIAALCTTTIFAQHIYTTANAHAHNDYQNTFPFRTAYDHQFGSMEADIFLSNDSLIVGHTTNDLVYKRTLQNLYLTPLQNEVVKHNGYPYADTSLSLQMLIDLKTEGVPTLQKLVDVLQTYPSLIHSNKIQFVITGNRPVQQSFTQYPSYIYFDGELHLDYSADALSRIVMLSDDFADYTHWNGKGRLTEHDQQILQTAVAKAHALHKKVRFWDAPDFINAWQQFMALDMDYINTDHIAELSTFFQHFTDTHFTLPQAQNIYQPTYTSDGKDMPVKNVILLIGDGTALPQMYAGYTANHGALNVFNMRHIGLSKTSSYNNYVTDSAPGATSIASGEKTNNRYVGVDHTGKALPLLPLFLSKKNIKTGLVTCGDITDATPADFYGHVTERDSSLAIIRDLKNAPIQLLMGSGNESLTNVALLNEKDRQYFNRDVLNELEPEYKVVSNIDSVTDAQHKWIVMEQRAGLSMLKGRGDWLSQAFDKATNVLSQNKDGFFMMLEGAQIDYGGHANNLPYVATEMLDFDKVIGKALQFADTHPGTLVIVTADHETGGLTLLDGDYNKGYVSGQFSTNDHTALPVMVFAYGPHADYFNGVYENTALFGKILKAYGVSGK